MGHQQRYLIAVAVGLASSVAILVSGRLAVAPDIVIPAGALAGTLALIGVFGPARGGLAALVLMATLNRYTAEVAGVSLKPEHIAVPVVALVLTPQLPRLLRRLRAVDIVLLAWLGWSVVGGLLNAPDPWDSTRLWVMLLLAAFPYFAIVTTARTAGRFATVVWIWMAVAIAAGLFGIVSHVLYAWNVNLGIQINPVTADPTMPSTFRESNLFGSAMMILSLTGLGMLALGHRSRQLAGAAVVVGLVGLQVSFTRTAWAALIVGLLVLAALLIILTARNAYRMPADLLRPAGAITLLVVILTTIVWLPVGDADVRAAREARAAANATSEARAAVTATAGSEERDATRSPLLEGTPTPFEVPTVAPENPDIVGRVGSIADTSDSSIRIRIDFARQALRDWRDHPIEGRGIGAFGQTYTTTSYNRAWLSNTFVRTLHDSGVVGIILFLLPLGMLARDGLRLTDRIGGDLERLAFSLAIAVVGMFVAFQATEGFQLAWYWLVLGLYAAAVRLAHERRARMV